VGAAGYDIVRYIERLPPSKTALRDLPEGAFIAPESLLVFDHLTRRVALLHAGSEAERLALRRDVIHALRGGVDNGASRGGFSKAVAGFERERFLEAVGKSKQYIAAGDIYQIVLSVRFSGRSDLDPFQTYRGLRLLNPSPYMYYFEIGDLKVAGSSPEALVRLDGREASLRPIAGTRPRGATAAEDLALERELLADPKENAEHVMLVDLARNDLGRVASAGSVHVDPFRRIERYSHVMHIVSEVEGMVDSTFGPFDALRATFPAGTLSGAPKVRAMQIIRELELRPRGAYGGAIGYVTRGTDLDFAIAIRTVVMQEGRFEVTAGAGIVADSVPELEAKETWNKARAALAAIFAAKRGADAPR
jgi:anthranilate synthase component 1